MNSLGKRLCVSKTPKKGKKICLLQQKMSCDPSEDGANGLLFIHTLLEDIVVTARNEVGARLCFYRRLSFC